jgi:hypothetical protein
MIYLHARRFVNVKIIHLNLARGGMKLELGSLWNVARLKCVDIGSFYKTCNEALFKLTAEGPSVMHVKLLEERLEKIESREINR